MRHVARWTVLYDGSCPLCRRSALELSRLDRQGECLLVDGSDPEAARTSAPGLDPRRLAEAVHVVDGRGRVYAGFFAVRELARLHWAGRLLRPLLFLPGAAWAGRRIYAFVARHRSCLHLSRA